MAVMPPAGTEFAGYRLVWVVSKGDTSTLFLAEDPYLGAVIALKVLDPSLADDDGRGPGSSRHPASPRR